MIRKKIVAGCIIFILFCSIFITGLYVDSSWFFCNAADISSKTDNTTVMNVTVLQAKPIIYWYDFQVCTNDSFDGFTDIESQPWESRTNSRVDVDNETWCRFVINISSDQGWDNIEYINISGWHDNGSDVDKDGSLNGQDGYNRSNNRGANRNFFMYYDNTSNTSSYYNLTYPCNNKEITIGGFTERNVSAVYESSNDTQTHNLSFVFKPGFQFRYAPGPGMSGTWIDDPVNCTNGQSEGPGYNSSSQSWESFDNLWSWNFNISVTDAGEGGNESSYCSWARDEFGVNQYTEIISTSDVLIIGRPDGNHSTNSSSWYNKNYNAGLSTNISIKTVSNGNYSLTVNLSDINNLDDNSIKLNKDKIWVRGGNRISSLNFSSNREYVFLYGDGNMNTGIANSYDAHEVNGTCKYAGEAGDDGKSALYPNDYDSSSYNGLNPVSHYLEFTCYMDIGTIAGRYTSKIYYHLKTQT